MRDLRRWTIAASLAALAGAGAAYLARGGRVRSAEAELTAGDHAEPLSQPSDDARDALDAARARLRARAEELRREIEDAGGGSA